MELRHLRYFVATAQEMHFTRAAAKLNIGQPPLSQQIRELEREIGVDLFLRLGRRVELTEAGRSFFQDAQRILDLAERAKESARQFARGERGSVRIGFIPSSCFHSVVNESISRFHSSHPDVDLILTEKNTSQLLIELQNSRLDAAFLRPTSAESEGLDTEEIVREPMVVALPAGHYFARHAALTLRTLAKEPFVMYPRSNGSAIYDAIITACQNSGFSPYVVQEAPQIASTLNLVTAGIGVALVPESMTHLQAQRVIYRKILGPAPFASLSIASRKENLSAAASQFLGVVRQVASTAKRRRPVKSKR